MTIDHKFIVENSYAILNHVEIRNYPQFKEVFNKYLSENKRLKIESFDVPDQNGNTAKYEIVKLQDFIQFNDNDDQKLFKEEVYKKLSSYENFPIIDPTNKYSTSGLFRNDNTFLKIEIPKSKESINLDFNELNGVLTSKKYGIEKVLIKNTEIESLKFDRGNIKIWIDENSKINNATVYQHCLTSDNDNHIFYNNVEDFYPFHNCEIKNLKIESSDTLTTKNIAITSLKNNKYMDFKKLKDKNYKNTFIIKDTELSLINLEDTNKDTFDIKFQRCKFTFETKYIHEYYNGNQKIWQWHTKPAEVYKFLSEKIDLVSEINVIEKYFHYFKSRNNNFQKFLFWFNGAYQNLLIPGIISILSTLGIHFLISCMDDYLKLEYSGITYVFNVPKLFSDIIFKNFFEFNCIYDAFWTFFKRSFVVLLEIIFIYSSYCTGFAIKKKFGFPKV